MKNSVFLLTNNTESVLRIPYLEAKEKQKLVACYEKIVFDQAHSVLIPFGVIVTPYCCSIIFTFSSRW